MRTYPTRLSRRLLLSLPAMVAAAAVTVGLRPGRAKAQAAQAEAAQAEAAQPECVADLLGGQ